MSHEEFEATPDLLGELRFDRYRSRVDHYQRPKPEGKSKPMTEAEIDHIAEWLRELHELETTE